MRPQTMKKITACFLANCGLHRNCAAANDELEIFRGCANFQSPSPSKLRTAQELCGRRRSVLRCRSKDADRRRPDCDRSDKSADRRNIASRPQLRIVRPQNPSSCKMKNFADRTWNCAAAQPPEGHFCPKFLVLYK